MDIVYTIKYINFEMTGKTKFKAVRLYMETSMKYELNYGFNCMTLFTKLEVRASHKFIW